MADGFERVCRGCIVRVQVESRWTDVFTALRLLLVYAIVGTVTALASQNLAHPKHSPSCRASAIVAITRLTAERQSLPPGEGGVRELHDCSLTLCFTVGSIPLVTYLASAF